MATLLAIFHGRRCLSRCDANCYGRRSTRERCVCGGRNRRRGHAAALALTRANWWHWLDEWKAQHPGLSITRVIRPIRIIRIRPLRRAA